MKKNKEFIGKSQQFNLFDIVNGNFEHIDMLIEKIE